MIMKYPSEKLSVKFLCMMVRVSQNVIVVLVVHARLDVTLNIVFAKSQDKCVTIAVIQTLHVATNSCQIQCKCK